MFETDRFKRSLLLQTYTALSPSDIIIIEQLCGGLNYIACLTEADIFVNTLTMNEYDSIVLEWARPPKQSLYKQSVVGKLAHPFNEPAVYKTLVTGEPSFNVRGLSQERIPIAQTVVPIWNNQEKVIAALIMERDITEQVNQEAQVELLSETAQQLSRTLMGLSVNKTNFPDHLRDGVIVLDAQGRIQYINRMATQLIQEIMGTEKIPYQFQALPEPFREALGALNNNGLWSSEIHFAQKFVKVEGIPLLTKGKVEGAVVILNDITDLRQTEKELILKSVAIQEIHHRVKNNLQNMASLLRLQMRRVDHPLLKGAFTESIHRILSMALVYEFLANESLDDVEVKELCARIMKISLNDLSTSERSITTEITGSSLRLPSTQAVTLTLIINELMSNALKHAFSGCQKGNVSVEFSDCGSEVLLLVRDDGNGFQPKEGESGHLGLQIVKVLVEEKLNGSLSIKQEQGTVALIRFPKMCSKEV